MAEKQLKVMEYYKNEVDKNSEEGKKAFTEAEKILEKIKTWEWEKVWDLDKLFKDFNEKVGKFNIDIEHKVSTGDVSASLRATADSRGSPSARSQRGP